MADAERQGWALVVIDLGCDTSTASGRMVANLMATIGQWEREIIGERTSAALAVKKSQGQRLGRPVSLPDAVRYRIARERVTGSTWQAIADGLNADSVPTAKGGQWRVSTVHKVCKSVALDAEMAELTGPEVLAG